MGSSEPSLVPEWLRSNGHGNSGASAGNHFASANSHSASVTRNSARNSLSRTNTEIDNPRAPLERSSSINSRRSSSNNGSSKHPYSSFSRSHRDKERDKEKSGFGDICERGEPLGKDSLRRTRSMAPRNQGDSLPCRVASDPKKIEISNHPLRNGLVLGDKSVGIMPKASFEKDFPSLGADEKQVPSVVRVASPGLPIGSSSLVGEGWSALAEVPVVIGSNNIAKSFPQPISTLVASSTTSGGSDAVSAASVTTSGISNASYGSQRTSGASGSSSALNMAEALQSPVSRTTSQLSVETQRLEQMAINKVKQLIPMTPAMPKVLHSSDKLKLKLNARVGEISGSAKVGQQLVSSSLNAVGQSPRSAPVTPHGFKQSHGSKLFVLKPPWESNASSTSKDGSNIENGGASTRLANNSHVDPAESSAPVKSTNIAKASMLERKPVVSSLSLQSAVEKRPLSSSAQSQSRSDFFNSMRKKTPMTSAATTETDSYAQSPSEDKSCELLQEMNSSSPLGTEDGGSISNEDSSNKVVESSNRDKSLILCGEDIPDEEEAAFLRSLGWKESVEEPLTEKEINDFYQELMKSRPSLNLSPGVQPALSLLKEFCASNVSESSARLSSTDAALKSN